MPNDMSTETMGQTDVVSGTDDVDGVDLSYTVFTDQGPKTTFVGTNLSGAELLQNLDQLIRRGETMSAFADLPYPGQPGTVGIAMVRSKDYNGRTISHDWNPSNLRKLDLGPGRKRFFPLIQECFHSSLSKDTADDRSVSIRRNTVWSMWQTAENLSTGGRGFRETNTTAARFWLAPDGMETLLILRGEYPTLASELGVSLTPQWHAGSSV